jgi:microcin C transport system permease protein
MKNKISNKGWFNKFKSNRKSYLVLKVLIIYYALSFFLPFLVNGTALLIKYNDVFYFPVFRQYPASIFNEESNGEANYRKLNEKIKSDNNSNFVLMPLYPYGPNENLLDELNQPPPTPPSVKNIFGTDDRGRDVFARVLYGFNVSVTFGLVVTVFSFLLGILFGGISGFYGGLTDIFFQRAVEIWSALPFLYIVIVLSSLITPGFSMLIIILALLNWVGITLYVRGEVLREKTKDYVFAAYVSGASKMQVLTKHVLPNSMNPVISFAPFAVIGNISLLVALDFLGFGLQPPTANWGQLIQQGMTYSAFNKWWLIVFPLLFQFVTLILFVIIGNGFRDTFHRKQYSRLR